MKDKLRTTASWVSSILVRPQLVLVERRGGIRARPTVLALRAALDDRRVPVFAEIEQARRSLLNDSTPIIVSDFGAGIGGQHADPERASAGIDITKSVREAALPSKSEFWCRFLYWLTAEVRPRTVLEFGTCVGISASYQAAALRDCELAGSTIVSMEGSPRLADRSRQTVEELGLMRFVDIRCGRFSDTLPRVMEDSGPFDVVFIDGHHDEIATLEYFEALRGATTEDAVIIFDDIRWTDGMRRAWKRIKRDDRVGVSIDLGSVGICLLGENRQKPIHLLATLRGM